MVLTTGRATREKDVFTGGRFVKDVSAVGLAALKVWIGARRMGLLTVKDAM